jgi:hypothetical protein
MAPVCAAWVLLTACASQGGADAVPAGDAAAMSVKATDAVAKSAAGTTPPAPNVWEQWPPADAPENVARPASSGEMVEFPSAPEGAKVLDLLAFVSQQTGATLFYDETTNQKIKTARVQSVGNWRVPRSRLLDAVRAALSMQSLVLVPVGAQAEGGAWFVLDNNNAVSRNHPVVLRENEVLGYADCDGLFVVTTFRVRDTVDTGRMRQALTALLTQSAGGGRIQDVPGSRTVLVADFAPVVAAMKRVVDEVNRNGSSPPPPVPPPPVPPPPVPPPPTPAAQPAK